MHTHTLRIDSGMQTHRVVTHYLRIYSDIVAQTVTRRWWYMETHKLRIYGDIMAQRVTHYLCICSDIMAQKVTHRYWYADYA